MSDRFSISIGTCRFLTYVLITFSKEAGVSGKVKIYALNCHY